MDWILEPKTLVDKFKLILLTLVLMFLVLWLGSPFFRAFHEFSTTNYGKTIRLTEGLAAVNVESYDNYRHLLRLNDVIGLQDMTAKGEIIHIPKSSNALVLDINFDIRSPSLVLRKVRIYHEGLIHNTYWIDNTVIQYP